MTKELMFEQVLNFIRNINEQKVLVFITSFVLSIFVLGNNFLNWFENLKVIMPYLWVVFIVSIILICKITYEDFYSKIDYEELERTMSNEEKKVVDFLKHSIKDVNCLTVGNDGINVLNLLKVKGLVIVLEKNTKPIKIPRRISNQIIGYDNRLVNNYVCSLSHKYNKYLKSIK